MATESSVMESLFSYDNTVMLAAIISLLLVILFVLLLHLYARWFLSTRRPPSTVTTYDLSLPAHPTKHPPASGLSAAALASIPTFSYSTSAAALDCAVCLTDFEAGEVARRLPRCTHCFHVDCIDTWLRAHTTCPVCRLDVLLVVQCSNVHDVVFDVGDSVTSPESAVFQRLMRMAISRSCRSDVVNHRLDRNRPSV